MKKAEQLKENMPFELELSEGIIPDQTSMASDQRDEILIGSEIDPVHIEHSEKGDFENGMSVEIDTYLIKQNDKYIIVVQYEEGNNYGCQYQKNGGSSYFEAYYIPSINNLKTNKL